jgi:TatD DNase family protein
MLVDSHCHLDFPQFAAELDAIVGRARASGIGTMLTISTLWSRFSDVLAVAERFDNVFCSVGVHPHESASEGGVGVDALVTASAHPKVVAFGETGLDYHYEHSPRADQLRSFRTHIAAARETGLPVVIHSREADDDTIAVIEDEMTRGGFSGVLHCFGSSLQVAERFVALGLYISFSGVLTFRNADSLRTAAAALPHDRLLVETDAPYLAPVPLRGRRNEPAYVAHTAGELARVRGVSVETIARETTENFFRLFAKATPPATSS